MENSTSDLGSNARLARAIGLHLDLLPEGYKWEPSLVGNIKAVTLILERLQSSNNK